MIINAYQTAFHREGEVKIRAIVIPDEDVPDRNVVDWRTWADRLLAKAFKQGQNMFQPVVDRYSVSAGDVIELPDGSCHRVLGAGFAELEAEADPKALTGWEAREAGFGF